MRYWEFLIQQEGDQTWLPLETRQVEILEGRYRMAAHTSYDDTSVEVRVSQLLLDEIPPRRRVRKRKAMTNDSGLLAIFPYIQLSPGRWEIDCNSPDVIDDFLGEGGWHYSVQLQVTPRDDDWEPDWSASPADTAHPLESNAPALETDGSIEPSDLQLSLKQQAYVTQLGHDLVLTGHLSQAVKAPFVGQLQVELRDPQTATTIQETAFDLPKQSLPAPFSVTVTLPDELSTQVILGAISVMGQERRPLASASFTITIGLAQMLDAIANQPDLDFEEEISIFPGSTESFLPPPEKVKTLLAAPLVPKEIVPSEGLTLPPQLKPVGVPNPERQPELPEFPTESEQAPEAVAQPEEDLVEPDDIRPETNDGWQPTTAPEPDDDTQDFLEKDESTVEQDEPSPFTEPRIFEQGSIEDDDRDLELATAALETAALAGKSRFSETSLAEEALDYGTEPDDNDAEPDSERDAATAADQAFEKLQLRERFWQKLSQFTQDGYRQSLEVKKALDVSETLPEGNQQPKEFVAYEPPPSYAEPAVKQAAGDDEANRIQVMAPSLDVPEQELVAGEWIAVRVRVPASTYRPYVKVWMNDLQTRTLIEAPRLLMQFTPNDYDELETMMRIKVPTGCLELQFAAIAIDMSTLEESRKVVQNRRVMPPDESLSIFDDLNF